MNLFINIKIALAIFLSVLPFLCAFFIKQQKDGRFSSLEFFLSAHTPRMVRMARRLGRFLRNLHRGMRTRTTCRKFFVSLLTIFLIFLQCIDSWASTAAETMIKCGEDYRTAFFAYHSLVSSRLALFLCLVCTLILFSYRAANTLLTDLCCNKKMYFLTGGVAMFILVYSTAFFVFAEMLYVLLISAYLYCEQTGDDPRNKMPLTTLFRLNKGLSKLSKAA